jgi:hypothetical protein
MSSYQLEPKGNYIYITHLTSKWNKTLKSPRSTKKYIGKVDPITKRLVFKSDFIATSGINCITLNKTSIEVSKNYYYINNAIVTENIAIKDNLLPYTAIVDNENSNINTVIETLDNVKVFGVTYFINNLAKQIGLLDILKSVFPTLWNFILTLVSYIISSNKAMLYCKEWVEENHIESKN